MEEKKLIDVSEPVGQSIIKGIITGGLWLPLTIKNYREVARDEFDKLGINDNFVFAIFCLFGFGFWMYILGSSFGLTIKEVVTNKRIPGVMNWICEWNALRYLTYVGWIMLIAGPLMCIFTAFKMENLIKEQAAKNGIENYQVNKILLIIFHIYYVNYCLEEIKRLKK